MPENETPSPSGGIDECAERLREERARMRSFRAVVSHPTWTIEEQIRGTLEVGCVRLGLDHGRLGQVEDDGTVRVLFRRPDDDGADLPSWLGGLCRRTCRDGRPVSMDRVAKTAFAYLGVPVRVDGRPFGTLCFWGSAAGADLGELGIEYAELLACWLGTMVERLHAEELRGRFIEAVMEAQERERRRLARELHDVSGQNLIAVLLRLKGLEEAESVGAEQLEAVRELVKTTLGELRHLAKGLHPLALDDLGLEAAIRRLTAEITESHPLRLDLHLDWRAGTGTPMPAAVAQAVYRIVQEGLTNVVKHSGARTAEVRLDAAGKWYRLLIGDDGRGFDVYGPLGRSPGAGFGLHGIRERLRQLGGSLTVDAYPGGGTRLVVLIPRESVREEHASQTDDDPAGR